MSSVAVFRRTGLIAATAALALAGCASSTSNHPATAGSPHATGAAGPAARPEVSPTGTTDTMVCAFQDHGGTYYLDVTSATAHDFTVCNGAQPFSGTLASLSAMPHQVARRCAVGAKAAAADRATVDVYSSTQAADLAAAHAYCSANGS